ncbi:MBOAT family protein [Candidatus Nomurabacteria bacterium]|nr:MBOAT family protein [Candidatus Nomurabacteria bacterium]
MSIFLPATLLGYFLLPRKLKNYWLLFASLFFYAFGAPKFVFVLILSSLLDFFLAQALQRHTVYAKKILAFGVIFNIGLLGYFKYANFFVEEFSRIFGWFGFGGIHIEQIALPIGISFFTFQKISYLVDVYHKQAKVAKNFANYLLYVSLFPQLIAGPIIRYHDISKQIEYRDHSKEKFLYGVFRFSRGLAKKVLIADSVGMIADKAFSIAYWDLSSPQAWIGILAYAMQIYFDFSGYSDMAIGLCRMFGFVIPENFRMPYIAKNFTEFWQRWHISLSAWMKEYVYIPLGGNRVDMPRWILNLWIVFLLSGLWHGASTTFIAWGAVHGFFLMTDKLFWIKASEKFGKYVNIILTFFWICISWVLFRSQTLADGLLYIHRLIDFSKNPVILWSDMLTSRALAMLILALALSFIPAFSWYQKWWHYWEKRSVYTRTYFEFFVAVVLLGLSMLAMAHADFTPFIYFRF